MSHFVEDFCRKVIVVIHFFHFVNWSQMPPENSFAIKNEITNLTWKDTFVIPLQAWWINVSSFNQRFGCEGMNPRCVLVTFYILIFQKVFSVRVGCQVVTTIEVRHNCVAVPSNVFAADFASVTGRYGDNQFVLFSIIFDVYFVICVQVQNQLISGVELWCNLGYIKLYSKIPWDIYRRMEIP